MAVNLEDLRNAMTKKEFAELIGVSLRTVNRMIMERQVEVVFVGTGRGQPRITKRAATEYLNRQTKKVAASKKVG